MSCLELAKGYRGFVFQVMSEGDSSMPNSSQIRDSYLGNDTDGKLQLSVVSWRGLDVALLMIGLLDGEELWLWKLSRQTAASEKDRIFFL